MSIPKHKTSSNSFINRLTGTRPLSSKSISSTLSKDSVSNIDKKKNKTIDVKKNNVSFNNSSSKKNLKLNLNKNISTTQISHNNINNPNYDFRKN